MSPRLARFLTRLYPPAWRARYAEEFQKFLEARHVSAAGVLNVIGRAAVEHLLEDWRYALIVVALLFSAEGALYLASGHASGQAMAQHPILAAAWLGMECAALAMLLWAAVYVAPLIWAVAPKLAWAGILFGFAAFAFLQYLPWRLKSPWLAGSLSFIDSLMGGVGVFLLGYSAEVILGAFRTFDPQDLDDFDAEDVAMLEKYKPKNWEGFSLRFGVLGAKQWGTGQAGMPPAGRDDPGHGSLRGAGLPAVFFREPWSSAGLADRRMQRSDLLEGNLPATRDRITSGPQRPRAATERYNSDCDALHLRSDLPAPPR